MEPIIYNLSQEAQEIIARHLVKTWLKTLAIITGIVIVMACVFYFGGMASISENQDHLFFPGLAYLVSLLLLLSITPYYNIKRNLKAYSIIILEDRIVQTNGRPTNITLYRKDLKKVSRTASGMLLLRSTVPGVAVRIYPQINNAEELNVALKKWLDALPTPQTA